MQNDNPFIYSPQREKTHYICFSDESSDGHWDSATAQQAMNLTQTLTSPQRWVAKTQSPHTWLHPLFPRRFPENPELPQAAS